MSSSRSIILVRVESVTTSGAVRLFARYEGRGHIRPWRGTLQTDVRDGSLCEGASLL